MLLKLPNSLNKCNKALQSAIEEKKREGLTEYLSWPFPITLCNVDLGLNAKQVVNFMLNTIWIKKDTLTKELTFAITVLQKGEGNIC